MICGPDSTRSLSPGGMGRRHAMALTFSLCSVEIGKVSDRTVREVDEVADAEIGKNVVQNLRCCRRQYFKFVAI